MQEEHFASCLFMFGIFFFFFFFFLQFLLLKVGLSLASKLVHLHNMGKSISSFRNFW